jgi:xanthine dehydrogenase molybdenum-binding subunit
LSSTYNVIGQGFARIDANLKVTGDFNYYDDVHLQGMLYGRVLHSPYARATITAIDTSAAEALKGVRAVVTYKDAPAVPLSTVFNNFVLDSTVRYVGDEVAAVAADDPYVAEDALDLIKVTYQQLPALTNDTAARASGAPQLYPTETGNIAGGKPVTLAFGDVTTALSKSDFTVQGTFATQWQAHVRPKIGGCTADWSTADRLSLWEDSQNAHSTAGTLSKLFGISLNKIELDAANCGGTFGASDFGRYHEIACLLSRKAGRPVRLQYTRAEEFMASTRRYPMSFDIKMGAMKDGTVTGVDETEWTDCGATSGAGPTTMNRMNTFDSYRWTDGNWVAYPTYTNLVGSGPFRGYGGPEEYFALCQLLDQLAEKLNMDPVQFLKLNHVKSGDRQGSTKTTSGTFSVICNVDYDACLDKGAQLIGWSTKWHKPGQGPVSGTKKHGIGVVLGLHETWGGGTSTAIIQVKTDGTAVVYTGSCDMGQGLRSSLAAIAAEAIGMNFGDVWVCNANTNRTQYAGATVGSQAVLSAGNPVAQAGLLAQQQMFALAAPVLKVQANQLSASKGTIYVTSTPSSSITIKALMSGYTGSQGIVVPYTGNVNTSPGGVPTVIRIVGVHFAEVNVDTATGFVDVLNSNDIWDVGKAINPNIVRGNLVSGAVQGTGYGLTEENVVDPSTGRVLNPNFYEYGVLTPADDVYLTGDYVEAPQQLAPYYGQKGVGEVGHVLPAAAIANAVYNAIGKRITTLPITPAKILQALGKA